MSNEKTLESFGSLPEPEKSPGTHPCLLVLSGPEEGAVYGLTDGETVLGRSAEQAQIVLTGRGISRAHARIYYENGQLLVVDLESTNGIYVNSQRVTERYLQGGDVLALGSDVTMKVTFQDEAVRKLIDALYKGATLDELTGVLNRKSFLARLEQRQPDSVVAMVDVDDFKTINDTYGHPAGDAILQQLSRRLRASLAQDGFVGRYGGEEFILYVRRPLNAATLLLEGIRLGIASSGFLVEGHDNIRLTVSIGVAACEGTIEDMVGRADDALYVAKTEGRNRVISA